MSLKNLTSDELEADGVDSPSKEDEPEAGNESEKAITINGEMRSLTGDCLLNEMNRDSEGRRQSVTSPLVGSLSEEKRSKEKKHSEEHCEEEFKVSQHLNLRDSQHHAAEQMTNNHKVSTKAITDMRLSERENKQSKIQFQAENRQSPSTSSDFNA